MHVDFFYAEPLDRRDVKAIRKLIPELSGGRESFGEREIAATAADHVVFVARTERGVGKIVGMCVVVPASKFGRKKIFVEDVIVAEKFRGFGIGRAIMDKVIWYTKATGCYCVDLTTRPKNEAANKLYQSLGFKIRETNCYRRIIESD